MLRSYSSAEDYTENLSSKQIVDFGNAHLGKPNASSDLTLRVFHDLLPETVISRKEQDKQDSADRKTLPGISNVFEIICQVGSLQVYNSYLNYVIMYQADGTVLWRRYPCFCIACIASQWYSCHHKDIVGSVKVINLG